MPHSCGHRSCPHCQHHESQQCLERQLKKQVPAEYFLLTFTLPKEFRELAWQQRILYLLRFNPNRALGWIQGTLPSAVSSVWHQDDDSRNPDTSPIFTTTPSFYWKYGGKEQPLRKLNVTNGRDQNRKGYHFLLRETCPERSRMGISWPEKFQARKIPPYGRSDKGTVKMTILLVLAFCRIGVRETKIPEYLRTARLPPFHFRAIALHVQQLGL